MISPLFVGAVTTLAALGQEERASTGPADSKLLNT